MARYTGQRCVPVAEGMHDKALSYKELSLVLDGESGDSYISKKPVPLGVELDDTEYWAKSSVYDQKVKNIEGDIEVIDEVVTGMTDHIASKDNPHNVTLEQLNAISAEEKGASNGLATLGEDGKVPSSQLPSLALGETSSTAYPGDKGAAHVANKSNPHGVTASQIGLGNVENKSSSTIRGEITESNVTLALGYTPLSKDNPVGTGVLQIGDTVSAQGSNSTALGSHTIAAGEFQHVQGRYNISDPSNTYAHIVGGGSSDASRSNIHTLDWSGNAVYTGSVTASDFKVNNQSLKDYVYDTGWQNCTLSGVKAHSSPGFGVQVRRIGKVVHMRGGVSPTTSATSYNSAITLPSGFAPSSDEYSIQQGSGTNRYLLTVLSSGKCNISRYSNTTSDSSIPAISGTEMGGWLLTYATWFIN